MVHKRKVAVVVDSSTCLPRGLVEQSQIYVVPHELVIDERSFRDGVDIDPTEFYRILQESHVVPTTSSPKPAGFIEAFRSASEAAESVLCITLSAKFSAAYDSACVAAGMARAELPECCIRVVDAQAAAGAQGLIAVEAARAAKAGCDLDQVMSRVEELIPEVDLLAFLDTLYYLRRSGRVPRVAAWAGSLLGIKPLTELRLGEARVLGRPRSRSRAIERMLEIMKARVAGRPAHVNVMHAHAADDAMALRQRIEADLNCMELFVSEFTPVMGAHLGPGLVGLAFYADN